MIGATTSSLSLVWSLWNWIILDYEEPNGLTVRPRAPFHLSASNTLRSTAVNLRKQTSAVILVCGAGTRCMSLQDLTSKPLGEGGEMKRRQTFIWISFPWFVLTPAHYLFIYVYTSFISLTGTWLMVIQRNSFLILKWTTQWRALEICIIIKTNFGEHIL